MNSYKSEPQTLACNAQVIYDKLTNPSLIARQIEAHHDQIDAEARAHLDTVRFNADSIAIASPMGEVTLALDHDESVPGERVVYRAQESPVPINMVINLEPAGDDATLGVAELQLKLPAFMRAMVDGQLKQGAQRFGELLARIPFSEL